MHILFLSHYFSPEVNAPASRTHENAKRWVRAGHQVTVLTCVPNHPSGIVYPGYRNKLFQFSEEEGIRVLRVKTYLSPNKGFAKRIANYLSYLFSASLFCLLVKDVDLVVSTSPQFFCGLAGYPVSRLRRSKWVLEIRDLWPDSIIAVGALGQRWIIQFLKALETFMYRRSDHIVALTNAFKNHITSKKVNEEKVAVITNGVDFDAFKPLPRDNSVAARYSLNGKFVASFIGTHGMAHGLKTVLLAADRLKDYKNILFLMVGDGADRENLEKQAREMNLDNVLILGQQPKKMMAEFLAASDTCMVLLKKDDLFKTVIPSKIFEAMAMKRPIIMGVEGESLQIVQSAECALAIEPENESELADAVLKLSKDPDLKERLGNNGYIFAKKYYDREMLAEKYLNVLEREVVQPQLVKC
jgi:glycosyltransferase involved in cell wall biosynthesis